MTTSDAKGLVALFAKPPRSGHVKTRLAGELGDEGASQLAAAFLHDAWARLAGLTRAEVVLATTEHDASLPTPQWLQGDGDLGERMERVLRRGLVDRPWAMAIGADAPGAPGWLHEAAVDALADHDAVLAPTSDGGYWLVGLRTCPEGLFAGLPWSAATTFEATRARFVARGLRVAVLPSFADVDRPEDLRRLRAIVDADPTVAPATKAALDALRPHLRPRLSVVIPALDEAARIGVRLGELTAMPGIDEIVVVDGGSQDATRAIALGFPGVRVIDGPRGRARQMNAGARASRGEIVLFLHADVALPLDAARHVEEVLRDRRVVAGAFRTWHHADRPWVLSPLLHLGDVRSRVTRHPYGDQAPFVRREAFDAVGGFPDQPLMEDIEMARRLRRIGRIGLAKARVAVSARRFVARPVYYAVVMWTWPMLYRCGVPPDVLKRWYADVR